MLTYEQTLDAMQRDAGPLAALVFVPLYVDGAPAFRVVPRERRPDAERDEDHASSKRCGVPCEVGS